MLKPGEIFAGRYRIENELGRGGLGVVYACEHIHTGQKVALKLLLTDPRRGAELDAVVCEKFKLEQRVWSHAPSEHIVRVLDAGNLGADDREAGEVPAGTLYIVMEVLEETLQHRVERLGMLPPREVVRVLRQVARGLDEAHGCCGPDGRPAPIIHRDLTPKNIMFTKRSDVLSSAKLLDFGIAKQLVDGGKVTEVLLGTRAYTAPEQRDGRAVSAQTDVWAFGLIAYFALSGREYGPPIGHAPVRPSQRLQQQGVGGHLPEALDRWFLCCIEHDPERRFASAGKAAEALALALEGAEALVPAPVSPSSPPIVDPGVPAAQPLAVQDTAALPVAVVGAEAAGAIAAALMAEVRGARPGVTVRLQPGEPPQPEAESAAGEYLRRPADPRREHLTPGSALSLDTDRLASALPSPESRRFRWAPLALAVATLGGGALYFAVPEKDIEPPTQEGMPLTPNAVEGQSRSPSSPATDQAGGPSTPTATGQGEAGAAGQGGAGAAGQGGAGAAGQGEAASTPAATDRGEALSTPAATGRGEALSTPGAAGQGRGGAGGSRRTPTPGAIGQGGGTSRSAPMLPVGTEPRGTRRHESEVQRTGVVRDRKPLGAAGQRGPDEGDPRRSPRPDEQRTRSNSSAEQHSSSDLRVRTPPD